MECIIIIVAEGTIQSRLKTEKIALSPIAKDHLSKEDQVA